MVITSHGKPVAMIVGVERQALEAGAREEGQAEATRQARLTGHAAGARGGVFPIAMR